MAKKENQLIGKLQDLLGDLNLRTRCDPSCEAHCSKQWRDIPPTGKKKVPKGIDWANYPLITGVPVIETRPTTASLADLGDEYTSPRPGVRYDRRPWLPPPVDLGGNGKPWDLRRHRSRELVFSQLHSGCDCVKRNGLQDDCKRMGCNGCDLCRTTPVPLCRASGGPGGPCKTAQEKGHKNNCWCPQCRPSCCEIIPVTKPGERGQSQLPECPQCLCLQSIQCGTACDHYCDKHMQGAVRVPCPPIIN